MAPVATSPRDGLLEHPDEAFAAYRSAGVPEVICQEKHMGSRAVVLLCRDGDVATRRFGATRGETGVLYTRTGRAFLRHDSTEALLARLRDAATSAGLWDSLSTDWILLDAELLPWSLKAEGLLREQYAAVGAAARLALPSAVEVLQAAQARGLDVADLLGRTSRRADDATAFTAAYRRYCWTVDGLEGIEVAPFQVLATEGAAHHTRDHLWHLAIADRLVAAAPDLVRSTRRLVVDTGDSDSVHWATSPARARAWPSRASRSVAGSTSGSSTGLSTPSPPTSADSRTATSATSARSPCASTPSDWRRSTASSRVSRSGVSTSRCSRCSPWSRSRSTRASEVLVSVDDVTQLRAGRDPEFGEGAIEVDADGAR